MLLRSPKPKQKDELSFRHSPFLSKPEVKQYLMKLYNLNLIDKVHTARRSGKIMVNLDNHTHYRKQDWKKSYVKVDFEVDPDMQKIM